MGPSPMVLLLVTPTALRAVDLTIPKTMTHMGEYELVRLLGRGSFGKTVLARHRASGEQVAIKQILTAGVDAASKALQEAHTMMDLRHPQLVQAKVAFLQQVCSETPNLFEPFSRRRSSDPVFYLSI